MRRSWTIQYNKNGVEIIMPKPKFPFSIWNILILVQQQKKLIIVSNLNVYKVYTN